jgi:hypothetical protein
MRAHFLRKFYAAVGFSYDPIKDEFVPPQSLNNFDYDENTGLWNKSEVRNEAETI